MEPTVCSSIALPAEVGFSLATGPLPRLISDPTPLGRSLFPAADCRCVDLLAALGRSLTLFRIIILLIRCGAVAGSYPYAVKL